MTRHVPRRFVRRQRARGGSSGFGLVRALAFGVKGIVDYNPYQPFLNIFKSFRELRHYVTGTRQDLDTNAIDANGYYTEIPAGADDVRGWMAWDAAHPTVDFTGRYEFTWTGVDSGATVAFTNGATEVNRTDNGDNTETIVIDGDGSKLLELKISTIPSAVNCPRDFVLLKDEQDWKDRYNAGEVLNPDYIALLSRSKVLRFMDGFLPINNIRRENYSEFVGEDYSVWTINNNSVANAPVKVCCELCNRVRADAWFNFPAEVTDQFAVDFATEVLAELDSGLNVYIEFSNETWNGAFDQTHWTRHWGTREWGTSRGNVDVTNGSAICTMADTSALVQGDVITFAADEYRNFVVDSVDSATQFTLNGNWAEATTTTEAWQVSGIGVNEGHNFHTKRSVELIDQWLSVWTGADADRVIKVMGSQAANTGVSSQRLNASIWNGDGTGTWKDPRTYFDALAVQSYYGSGFKNHADWQTLVNQINTDGGYSEGSTAATMLRDWMKDSAKSYSIFEVETILRAQWIEIENDDLGLILYEGGTHILHAMGDTADEVTFTDFMSEWEYGPEAAAVYDEHFEIVRALSKFPYMQFVDIGFPDKFGAWGAVRYLGDTNDRIDKLRTKANAVDHWWLAGNAPQTTYVTPASRSDPVSQAITAIDLRLWFTRNAATFAVSGLPSGLTFDGTHTISGTPDTVETVNTTITATTSESKQAQHVVSWEITA